MVLPAPSTSAPPSPGPTFTGWQFPWDTPSSCLSMSIGQEMEASNFRSTTGKRKAPPRLKPSSKRPNAPPRITSRLLALPAELRLRIYYFLIPPARLPTVLGSRAIGVSAVSHKPPPLAFLRANQQLCAEALGEFYHTTMFKIEGLLDPANVWPIWQIERVLLNAPQLGRIRKVELSGFWHRVPGGGVEGEGSVRYAECVRDEVERRMDRMQRAVDVLLLAGDLRVVVLTWKELGRRDDEEDEGWEARRQVLRPLEKLRGLVRFDLGDLVAGKEVAELFMEYVGWLNGRSAGRR